MKFQKNSSYTSGVKRRPFEALLGGDAKVEIMTSALPHEVIHCLQSEDHLLSIITEEVTVESTSISSLIIEATSMPSPIVEATPIPTPDFESAPVEHEFVQSILILSENVFVKSSSHMLNVLLSEVVVLWTVEMWEIIFTIPNPIVDRGCGDPMIIVSIIMDIDENDCS